MSFIQIVKIIVLIMLKETMVFVIIDVIAMTQLYQVKFLFFFVVGKLKNILFIFPDFEKLNCSIFGKIENSAP